MTDNPVAQFELNLRRAVGLRSSQNRFDDAIKEICGHYYDLYTEAMNRGATIEEARKTADEKIGKVADIAKEVRSNSGPARGNRLQWIGVVLWLIGTFLYQALVGEGYVMPSLWGQIVQVSLPVGVLVVYLAGFIAALGIFRAKRIALSAFCFALILIPVGKLAFFLSGYKSFAHYEASQNRHVEGMHRYSAVEGPKLRERLDLFSVAMTGNREASDSAIQKLSASVHRPQDRCVMISEPITGKWIYPTAMSKVVDNNLTWVYFATTDSLDKARQAWKSSDLLLTAMPTIRKGAEAELAFTAGLRYHPPFEFIGMATLAATLQFFYSFLTTLLLAGIVRAMVKILPGRRGAL